MKQTSEEKHGSDAGGHLSVISVLVVGTIIYDDFLYCLYYTVRTSVSQYIYGAVNGYQSSAKPRVMSAASCHLDNNVALNRERSHHIRGKMCIHFLYVL